MTDLALAEWEAINAVTDGVMTYEDSKKSRTRRSGIRRTGREKIVPIELDDQLRNAFSDPWEGTYGDDIDIEDMV